MQDKVKKAFANQLNTNELLWELLDQMEADAIVAWKTAEDVENREYCHRLVSAVDALRAQIKNELVKLVGRDNVAT